MTQSALEHLLGAYLHPDWRSDYPDSLAAVTDFARSEPESAPQFRLEVTALLARQMSESELREYLLTEMDAWYLPDGDGWSSCSAWLRAAVDRVEDILHKLPAA